MPHSRPARRSPAPARLELLEARDCPAVIFQNDYSQDVNGFFTPARRALLEFAQQSLLPYLQDTLAAITPDPAAGNTVSYSFENTATGQQVTIDNPTIQANVIRVYLFGVSNAQLGGALGSCARAVTSVQGDQAWEDLVNARGQAGVLAAPASDTSVAVVWMDVNMEKVYYESTTPPPGDPNGVNGVNGGDMVGLFQHELLHPLGFNGKGNPATQRLVDANGNFTGPAVLALTGGRPVSMFVPAQNGEPPNIGEHWAPGTLFNGGETVMDGGGGGIRLTALDAALLKDVGWETAQTPPPGVLGVNPNPVARPVDGGGGGPAGGGGALAGRYATGQDVGGGVVRMNNPNGTAVFTVTPFPGFAGGVRTAAADFNGDGVPDLVAGTGPGIASRVRVLDGRTEAELFAVSPFEQSFTGGVFVAAGDLNGDGRAELVVTPDQGGGPRVQVYSGAGFGKLADFFGLDDTNFRGGLRPAVGDLNGDGKKDLIVAAGVGGGPRVTAWANADVLGGTVAGRTPLLNRFVFEQALRNGAYVAVGDVNGDGRDDLIAGGGPGGGPRVFILDGKALAAGGADVVLGNFFGGDSTSRGGARVAARDVNGDGKADVIVGAGQGSGAKVTSYDADKVGQAAPPALFGFDQVANFAGGVFVG